MARKLRLEYAGACYHVINRGNYRRDLFAAKGAAEAFQRCLFEAAARFGWRLHAFIIMRNHFHLAVELTEPNLSEGMKWLQGTWAARFNRFRQEVGRPFQGRYKALHVEPGSALAQVAHYIHLNPVRAKIVTAERLTQYRWSSLSWFIGRERPAWLVAETLLAETGNLPDTPAGWRRYQAYLGVLATEEAKLRAEKFGRLSHGWCIGSSEFKGKLRTELATKKGGGRERYELLGADQSAHREAREALWEEKLGLAAQAFGVNLGNLPVRKSAREKVELAAVLKTATSVSNTWLAKRLQMGPPASVSQYVRRYRLSGGTACERFNQVMSRVNT